MRNDDCIVVFVQTTKKTDKFRDGRTLCQTSTRTNEGLIEKGEKDVHNFRNCTNYRR